MISPRHIFRLAMVAAVLLLVPAIVAEARADGIAGSSGIEIPIRVRSGHVYVDVEINGKGPFHFLFDTGASNVLTPEAAKRLGLPVRNNVDVTGTGGTQAAGSTMVDSLQLGGVTLANQTFYVLDLPPGASDEVPVDGLIGFEVLDRFPVRLDYAGATLTLYTGKDARYTGPAAPARLSFRGRTPQIDGKVDGIDGRFTIDTGSTGSLTLSAPFVTDHDLATHYHARTRVMSARGIGGPVYALLARAELLDLGTATAKRPVTFLSQQRAGTSARKDTAGNIGFGVLRQFTIFFDYPRKQIYFQPNADWGQPDLADRSGLRLERSDQAFAIAFVAKGSPADAAGLKAGDHIVTVNAAPSSTQTLEDVRKLLKGPVGTHIPMISDHGPVVVVLADL
ncbi:aspartyl protease family protein [Sphingomonas sp. ERG5]|uniref:aspartyl protease family protein n=1 Tax=Sphingomonas sp. ERG5 TaxID=1381597 RepID=UPI00068C72E2|nr:aspartyl protease family protein [Sphingomonas sp. ERG5]